MEDKKTSFFKIGDILKCNRRSQKEVEIEIAGYEIDSGNNVTGYEYKHTGTSEVFSSLNTSDPLLFYFSRILP